MKNENISIHPKWGTELDNLCYLDKDTTKIVIGTMPPYRFCEPHKELNTAKGDIDFFYGSYENNFWKYIGEVNNINFSNELVGIKERKQWLKDNKIGMMDITKSCEHTNGSALDKHLINIEKIDIKNILENYKNVNTLIYTSKYVASLIQKTIKCRHKWDDKNKKRGHLKIGDKKYQVIVLYSPSKNAIRRVKRNIILKEYEDVFKEGLDNEKRI